MQQVADATPSVTRVLIKLPGAGTLSAPAQAVFDCVPKLRIIFGIERVELQVAEGYSAIGTHNVDRAPVVPIRIFAGVLLGYSLVRIAEQAEREIQTLGEPAMSGDRVPADRHQDNVGTGQTVILLSQGPHFSGGALGEIPGIKGY